MKNETRSQSYFSLTALAVTAVLVAGVALILTALGNPANMGLCAACFIRDTAGALGLHHNVLLQYARPEVVGVILGAFVLALARREFVPLAQRTGSAPVTRFVLGFTMMIGALIFLGCPLRMLLRIAGGDLNALVGLFGFIAGILIGLFFIKRGFSLGQRKAQKQLQEQTEKQAQSMAEGGSINVAALILLAVMVFVPSLLLFSAEGLGSMYAPLGASLLAGLAVGAASFFSRFCIVGAFRDSFLLKKVTPTLLALCVLLVVAALGNLVLGSFNLGFEGQPVAHTEGLWNFLGLALVGLSAVLVSGCPMRQLVLAGGGSSDATLTIAGMMAAAAIAHNFQIAATPAGVSNNGMLGFGLALAATLAIAVIYTFSAKRKQANSDDSQAEEGTVKTKPRLTGLCAQAHNGEHE